MTARKATPHRFTAAELAALEPIIVRAAVAAVRMSQTYEAFALYVESRKPCNPEHLYGLDDAADNARLEMLDAGKALDRAMAKLRGGK